MKHLLLFFFIVHVAAAWNRPVEGLLISEEEGKEAVRFVWDGTQLDKRLDANKGIAVEPGDLLHAEWSHRLEKEEPGFRVDPFVRFLDADGKFISESPFVKLTSPLPRPEDADIIDFEEFIQVPATASRAAWSLRFYGNPGILQLVNARLTPGAIKPKSDSMQYTQWKNPDRLDDPALDAHLEKRSPVEAKIVRWGESNTIELNGKRITPVIFLNTGYNHIPNMRYNMASAYSQAGIPIFTVVITLGCGRPSRGPSDIWLGPGQYNMEPIRAELRKLLKEAPDCNILIDFIITPYRGYGLTHPDELFRSEDGQFGSFFHGYMRDIVSSPLELPIGKDGSFSPPSYYSKSYNDEVAGALSEIASGVAAMPEGKAVAGVYLNGGVDGQWFDLFNSQIPLTADYSPAALAAFKKYLRIKYANKVKSLRRSWQEPAADFDHVRIPLRNELWLTDRNFHTLFQDASRLSDYCDFLGYNLAQRQIQWCEAIKKGSGGAWLAGSYFSNSGLRGYPQLGLQSVRHLLAAPAVDMLAMVPNYNRDSRSPVHQGGFDGSLVRHGKLIITELDLRTGELPYWGLWGTPFWRSHNPADRFDIDTMRFAASAIEKGGTFHIYDMEGGCFNSTRALAAWQRASSLFQERSVVPVTEEHIGVIASERFWSFQSFGSGRMAVYEARETPRHALYRTGVRHATYLLEDVLSKDFKAPRVMIFLDACTMTNAEAQSIRKRFGNSGRVLVWLWAPGMFSGGDENNPARSTDFRLKRAVEADDKPLFVNGTVVDPLLENVRGFLFPHTPEYGHGWGMAYSVEDPSAKNLANYYGTDIPGMAVKRKKKYTEVYLGAPGSLTPALCRNFAREADLQPFLDSNDFSGIGSGLLYVSALTSGIKSISLPDNASLDRILTGQTFVQEDGMIRVAMKSGELLILKLQYRR